MAITQGVVVPRTGAIWCAAVIGSTGPIGPVPVSLSSSCSGAPYRWRAFRSSTNRIALAVASSHRPLAMSSNAAAITGP